ncbi:MAG TPA: PilZ domain-containing protein, partial [Pyrinomonadaceae bacterium]|nr:PilZ domain-containing protein [Pyrinomonadaceae bacterium]
TVNISALGLAVVLHAQNIDEQYLLGTEGSMAIELDLPNGLSIEFSATPVRYEKLDEGYLIGARISEMSERNREFFEAYLREISGG